MRLRPEYVRSEAPRPLLRFFAVAALLVSTLFSGLLVSACGYTTRSMISDQYTTIAVPIFENTTCRHDLEFQLTRAVVEELNARTHLVVVSDPNMADLVMTGRLVDVKEDSISRRKYQRPRDAAVIVTAEIEVKDMRSGEIIVSARKVSERESYSYLVQEDLRTSREEAIRALAERVVRQMEEGW